MPFSPPPLLVAGLASFEIEADGQVLDGSYRVLRVSITKGVNAISSACFEVMEDEPATGDYPVVASTKLLPGTEISIKAGYDNQHELLFSGPIVQVGITSQGAQGITVRVECRDKAYLTSTGRHDAVFENKTTSAALADLIATYSGLTADLAATTQVHEALSQSQSSDWDFIVMQAEANGHIVLNDLGKISTVEPSTADPDVLTLEYGTNVYSFSLDLDARTQPPAVKASAWDHAGQQMVEVTASAPPLTTPGTLSTAALAAASGQGPVEIRTTAAIDQVSLQKIADTLLLKLTLAKVRGRVQIPGTSLAKPGTTVNLSRLGRAFSGRAFVSEVTHTWGEAGWLTQLTLGMEEKWFAQTKPDVASATAPGSTSPPVHGLYTAVVTQIQQDPKQSFRVQVTVPVLKNTLWARLAQPYATKAAGYFFYPEVGDEVIVGFFGGDQRDPIILGALYSSARGPAYTPGAKNAKKAIVTAAKLTLEFDDDQKVLTLQTPGGNKLVISDAAQGLTLTDQQQNTITLAAGGLTLESKSALTITAAQDLVLKSTGGSITIEAATTLLMSGLSAKLAGTTDLALSSNATAKLAATGPLTVQGGVVAIN